MYAVVKQGGKQFRIQPGDVITVERMDAEVGEKVDLDQLLLVSADDGRVVVGQPTVAGAKAVATVVDQGKHRKVLVFRMKPKKNMRRLYGHRQPYTRLRIEEIQVGGLTAADAGTGPAEPVEPAEPAAREPQGEV